MSKLFELEKAAREHRDRLAAIETHSGRANDIASIVFVSLAQSEYMDDVTITENSTLFAVWDAKWTGKRGTILLDEGKLYRSLHDIGPGQNTKPSTDNGSLWQKIGNPAEEWPEWVQFYGVGDAYTLGDKVTHNGKRWICTGVGGDGKWNIWEPGVYGWTEQP